MNLDKSCVGLFWTWTGLTHPVTHPTSLLQFFGVGVSNADDRRTLMTDRVATDKQSHKIQGVTVGFGPTSPSKAPTRKVLQELALFSFPFKFNCEHRLTRLGYLRLMVIKLYRHDRIYMSGFRAFRKIEERSRTS